MKNDINYKIDLTTPPIGPPSRLMKETLFSGLKETKQSIKITEQWQLYIKEYMEEFRKGINYVI